MKTPLELAVPCPVCAAPIGKPCNIPRPRHRKGVAPKVHRGRALAAELERADAEQLRLGYQVALDLDAPGRRP